MLQVRDLSMLVDAFQKARFIISYIDMLLMHDVWGLKDVSESMFIPQEIAKDVSVILFVGNDDFTMTHLTGNAEQAHRINAMFVQRQSNEDESTTEKISLSGKKREIFKKLKDSQGID